MTTLEIKKMIEEYPILNKPCYTENLNKGQKNIKEIFSGKINITKNFFIPNILIVVLFFMLNVLFIIN